MMITMKCNPSWLYSRMLGLVLALLSCKRDSKFPVLWYGNRHDHDVLCIFAVVWNKPSTKTLKLDLNYSSNCLIIRLTA